MKNRLALNGAAEFKQSRNCFNAWDTLSNLMRANFDSLDLGIVTITNVVDFYKKTNTSLEHRSLGGSVNLGFIPQNIVIPLDPPDRIYQFPMNFGNSHTSSSGFNIDLSQFGLDLQFAQTKNRVTTVEGWGALITPYTTYPNTIKVKSVISDNSSVTFTGTSLPSVTVSSTTYSWFTPGYGIPVLEAEATNILGAEVYTSVKYIDTPQCLPPPFALFSNVPIIPTVAPASDSVLVNFNNFSFNSDSFIWDFGDPNSGTKNTSTLFSPTHYYTSPGTYTVRLTACNTVCSPTECNELSYTILILNSGQLIANFNYNPTTIYVGDTVFFTNLSANHNSSSWNFGDGFYSLQNNPVHQYTAPGTYHVSLIVNNAFNTDTVAKQLVVNDTTTGIFSVDNNEFQVKIFPNPASDEIKLSISSNQKFHVPVKLNIYDIAGGLILTETWQVLNTLKVISSRHLPNGIFFYEISVDQEILNRGKLIIQR